MKTFSPSTDTDHTLTAKAVLLPKSSSPARPKPSAFTYPGKFHWLGKKAHDHDIKANIAYCFQPLGDKLRLQFFHQTSNFIIHHVGCGVKPLEHHGHQPGQAFRRCVLTGCAEAHLEIDRWDPASASVHRYVIIPSSCKGRKKNSFLNDGSSLILETVFLSTRRGGLQQSFPLKLAPSNKTFLL